MKLLPGETVVSDAALENLTVTTHRVRYDRRSSSANHITSITLDAVSSCGLVSKSYPILLVLGLLFVIGSFFISDDGGETPFGSRLGVALVYALVFIVAYFLTRRVALAISSPGESIMVSARGVAPDALIETIETVEQAKLNYLAGFTEYGENTASGAGAA